jgi:hypothetical protein
VCFVIDTVGIGYVIFLESCEVSPRNVLCLVVSKQERPRFQKLAYSDGSFYIRIFAVRFSCGFDVIT